MARKTISIENYDQNTVYRVQSPQMTSFMKASHPAGGPSPGARKHALDTFSSSEINEGTVNR